MRASTTPLSWHCYMLPVVHKAKLISWAMGWTSGEFQFVLWQRQDNISHTPLESKNAWSCAYTPPPIFRLWRLKMTVSFVTIKRHTYSFAAVSLPFLYTATFETRNIEKYWVAIEWNGAVSCKPRFCVNITWCGQFACRPSATSAPTTRIHDDSIASQVTWLPASFRYLFGYQLARGLFYVLMSHFSLYLKRSFLSPLPCLFISIRGFTVCSQLSLCLLPFPNSMFFVSCHYFCLFMCIFSTLVISSSYFVPPFPPYFILSPFALGTAQWVQWLACGLDDQGMSVRFPVAGVCLLVLPTRPPPGPTQLWSNGYRRFFILCSSGRSETLATSSDDIENEWICTSTPRRSARIFLHWWTQTTLPFVLWQALTIDSWQLTVAYFQIPLLYDVLLFHISFPVFLFCFFSSSASLWHSLPSSFFLFDSSFVDFIACSSFTLRAPPLLRFSFILSLTSCIMKWERKPTRSNS